MLQTITLPIAELVTMEPAHVKLMAVLLSFRNIKNGLCCPSLRTIAKAAGQSLAWVQKRLHEMENPELGYFQRARLSGSYVYRIAERFLPQLGSPRPWTRREQRSSPRNSQAYQQAQESTGVAHKESGKDSPPSPQGGSSQNRVRGSSPAGGYAGPDEVLWRARLGGWLKRRFWLPMWGARPGERGCDAPAWLLRELAGPPQLELTLA